MSEHWATLSKAVVAHATFQNIISGQPTEAALAYPIQIYLGIKDNALLAPEHKHPLSAGTKLGRPFQIDFVGISRQTKKISWALETKIFNGTKRERLIKDIAKLLLLADEPNTLGAARYLLVLFPTKNTTNLVFKADDTATHQLTDEKPYPNLFDILLPWQQNGGEKRVSIKQLPARLQREFSEALASFDVPQVRDTFSMKLLGRHASDDFVCGVWQIMLSGKTDVFVRQPNFQSPVST